MRITVLTHNYPRFAGDFSGSFVQALCREWMAQGQEVDVLAPFDAAYNRPMQEAAGNGIIRIHPYRYIWPTSLHKVGYGRSMQSDLKLRLSGYLLSPAFFYGGIQAAMRHCRQNRPDVIHAHWALPNGYIGAVVSRRLDIPLVVSIPGSDAQVANSNAFFQRMARTTFAQASLITANSGALRDAVLPLGVDPAKFEMIIYGVDPNAMQPNQTGVAELRASLGIQPGEAMVLAVGRLVAKKGFNILVQALADPALRQRPVKVVVVGKGDEEEGLHRLSEFFGLQDHIQWVGAVPYDQIAVYYNACDMLVMPSITAPADGLNVCVLDAMSCAKPVIGSTAAGNDLAIQDGVTGFLVPEQHVADLAHAIAKLVDEPVLGKQMGLLGRMRVESELSWPVLSKRYLDHFARLGEMKRMDLRR